MCLLYDIGARLQERVGLSVEDLSLNAPAHVRVLGKGRKVGVVPLMDNTVTLMRDSMQEHDLASAEQGDRPLFSNRQGIS